MEKRLSKQMKELEKLFVINPVPIRTNRETKPRLDNNQKRDQSQ